MHLGNDLRWRCLQPEADDRQVFGVPGTWRMVTDTPGVRIR